MKPAKLDLPTIWRGCDWGPVILKWKDANGMPIDLSGWQPFAKSLNINLKALITDAPNGVTQLALTRIDTANLRLGDESWDWIWEHISGDYRFPPFLAGKVPIKEPQSSNGVVMTPPPNNDNIADAFEIFGETGNVIGSNVNATREPNEPAGENSVWYKWTPNREKTAVMAIGMDWLHIAIFVPADSPELPGEIPVPEPPSWGYRQIAHSSGNPSAVSWPAHLATTYWIRLYKNTRTSAFNLAWRMQTP